MQSTNTSTLDNLTLQIHSISNAVHLWNESSVSLFEQRSLTKQILCGKTNALINTYFANADDPQVQYIGEQLLDRYTYADAYLVQLQSAISTAIETNRANINKERQLVESVVTIRARNNTITNNARIAKRETDILKKINQLPEDLVNHIKSYLPATLILCAISIPNYDMTAILSPLKLKNVKNIYDRMRKNTSTLLYKMRGVAGRDIIRDSDIDIFLANQPGPSKNAIIGRIRDICYCYNLVLNILSRLKNTKPRESRDRDTIYYCNEANKLLYNELTYLYKLMNFAARPQHNGRAKPKPKSKPTNSPEMPIVSV
jgi:hypothetical protein